LVWASAGQANSAQASRSAGRSFCDIEGSLEMRPTANRDRYLPPRQRHVGVPFSPLSCVGSLPWRRLSLGISLGISFGVSRVTQMSQRLIARRPVRRLSPDDEEHIKQDRQGQRGPGQAVPPAVADKGCDQAHGGEDADQNRQRKDLPQRPMTSQEITATAMEYQQRNLARWRDRR
jgi:hypothetical protein